MPAHLLGAFGKYVPSVLAHIRLFAELGDNRARESLSVSGSELIIS